MSEVTDSTLAVAMPTDFQSNLILMFGEKVQQITTFSRNLFDRQMSSVASPKLPIITIERPTSSDRSITINNLPPVSHSELDHCIIERLLNHTKEAYIKGRYEDAELKASCQGRQFSFCMVYLFQHDGDNTLTVDFYISHTKKAPTWITGNTTNSDDSRSPMNENEVNLIADAYIRQCVHALRNYFTLVYNDAVRNNTTPNYYDSKFPKAARFE